MSHIKSPYVSDIKQCGAFGVWDGDDAEDRSQVERLYKMP